MITVILLSQTAKILETIWNVWQASRTEDPIEPFSLGLKDPEERTEIQELFFALMQEQVPILEMVEFIFLLEGVPVSLREQMVRHRMGIKFDDRLGVDIIPNLMDSTWWAQSMRVLDMGSFYKHEHFFIPETIKKNSEAKIDFLKACATAEEQYNALVEKGIPREDARQVIPLGATHRIVWKISLPAVMHICRKRSCWIAQLGMWKEVIDGIVEALIPVIGKGVYSMTTPPCMRENEFTGCLFCEHNLKRIIGEMEEMPPCSLFLANHTEEAAEHLKKRNDIMPLWIYKPGEGIWISNARRQQELYKEMCLRYAKFWNRDADSGVMLDI